MDFAINIAAEGIFQPLRYLLENLHAALLDQFVFVSSHKSNQGYGFCLLIVGMNGNGISPIRQLFQSPLHILGLVSEQYQVEDNYVHTILSH
jgi:hypothetical protein